MAKDRQIRITVERRGRQTLVELPFGGVLIGSGSHCDVRLLPEEAAERQLSLEPSGDGLRVRSLARTPRCTYQGLAFDEIVITDDERLELDDLALIIEVRAGTGSEADDQGGALKKARQVLMLAGLLVGYWYVLDEPPVRSSLRNSVPAPALFAAAAERSCPQQDVQAARAYAEEQFVLAESRRERSPFRIHDGVLAVPLYETAAACFRQAQVTDWADESREAADTLRREVADTFHTHQVRLEWFLGRNKYEAARAEVVVLRELLRGRSDAYATWLASVERELVTVIAAQKPQET